MKSHLAWLERSREHENCPVYDRSLSSQSRTLIVNASQAARQRRRGCARANVLALSVTAARTARQRRALGRLGIEADWALP